MVGMRGPLTGSANRVMGKSPWSARLSAHTSTLSREEFTPYNFLPWWSSTERVNHADATSQNVITDSPVPLRTRKISEDRALIPRPLAINGECIRIAVPRVITSCGVVSATGAQSPRARSVLAFLIFRKSAITITKSQMQAKLSTTLMADVIEVPHMTVSIFASALSHLV
jgi:hypothetical protein